VAAGLLLAAALGPLARSLDYLGHVSRPGTRDTALDWIETRLASGSIVLNALPELGIDRSRFEVLSPTGSPELDRLLARQVELVVWSGEEKSVVEGLRPLHVSEPEAPESGPRIALYDVPAALRPVFEEVPLSGARLTASNRAEDLPALADGRLDTHWTTEGPAGEAAWVQVDLASPRRLGWVELRLGSRPQRHGRNLHLLVTSDGGTWRRVRVVAGRPPVEEQLAGGRPASQVLLLEPLSLRGVRLVQKGGGDRRWGFAELRLRALREDPGPRR